jgi:hypothetical protein
VTDRGFKNKVALIPLDRLDDFVAGEEIVGSCHLIGCSKLKDQSNLLLDIAYTCCYEGLTKQEHIIKKAEGVMDVLLRQQATNTHAQADAENQPPATEQSGDGGDMVRHRSVICFTSRAHTLLHCS